MTEHISSDEALEFAYRAYEDTPPVREMTREAVSAIVLVGAALFVAVGHAFHQELQDALRVTT